jgi:4-hydroxyproline epimerase
MQIRVIVRTAGEPTRTGAEGGAASWVPSKTARRDFTEFDAWRSAIVNEPRGSDAMVGALLCAPHRAVAAGVIFFNNVSVLGMCGHGTIGSSPAHRGNSRPRIDTPVGAVDAELQADGSVSLDNVPSYRSAAGVLLDVPGVGRVSGDVAWGGNWFFLVREPGLDIGLRNLEALTEFAWRVRQAANAQGHPAVDHVELFGQPADSRAHSRNHCCAPRQGLRPLALRHGHENWLVSRPMTPSRKARNG